MASSLKNLSEYKKSFIPNVAGYRFGLVVSEWNDEITDALAKGAIDTLLEHGVIEDDIIIKHVPGAFELSIGAQFMMEHAEVDAVICIGCVIKGETPHFDYICQGVTQGITSVGLDYNTPVIFGVLTTNNLEQAQDRAGGKHGNKGVEAAITAIKMAFLQEEMIEEENEDE